ncbi:MAG: ABC transporter ATP-binding protein [Thermodesulfobacteriota bacterium]
MSDDIIIEVQHLSHRFSNGAMGVDNVSLCIREGAFVIMAGPNGSGKTTLLRHLNGLMMPSAGTVAIKGVPVKGNLLRARRMVGMVFQDADSQIVGETVREDVAFGPGNLGLEAAVVDRRTDRALEKVGLPHKADVSPHLLSGGEKRRLAIAGVLSMQPEIILFDEPFSNLDYPGICQVVEQMKALKIDGHTIVVTSHDMDPVIGLADSLVILDKGRIVREGEPSRVAAEAAAFGIRPPAAFMQKEAG